MREKCDCVLDGTQTADYDKDGILRCNTCHGVAYDSSKPRLPHVRPPRVPQPRSPQGRKAGP